MEKMTVKDDLKLLKDEITSDTRSMIPNAVSPINSEIQRFTKESAEIRAKLEQI